MNLIASTIAVALALAAPAFSQIRSGYYTDGNGNVARVDVVDTPAPGKDVQVTDASGFTPVVVGTSDGNGGVRNFPPATTNSPLPNTYRGHNGKVQRLEEDGTWTCWRPCRPPRGAQLPPNGSSSGGYWKPPLQGGDITAPI